MTAQQIRQAYLDFFTDRGHSFTPRALLIPHNDPSTLFTGSGMQPLIPYLLGESHPDGVRLVNSQTCLRAQDIEEVGDNRHTTFFEMLGNWSLGDYFKVQELPWFFEFLTDNVKLDPQKLYVTCFSGDKQFELPKDEESASIWRKLFNSKRITAGIAEMGSESDAAKRGMNPGERIFYYDATKNWWCRAAKIQDMPLGEPGGPDSEVFYRFYERLHTADEMQKFGQNCHPNCDCGQFLEIGNSVFMEYVKTIDGFKKLPKQNVDFGGGLERIAAANLDSPDVYKISLLQPIIAKLEELSAKNYESHTDSMRIIADHLRAATFMAIDGILPSNKEQGYVMRRLLRRAIRHSFKLGIEQNFLNLIVPEIAEIYEKDFPEVAKNRNRVIDILAKEEKIFRQTLRKGLKEFDKLLSAKGSKDGILNGQTIFLLYDTYGFPVELSYEEALIRGLPVDADAQKEFLSFMAEQRQRSHTASKGLFKGGLGGQTLQHRKYHTATHLMYQALRDVLGEHVIQRGSNITEERLRFDFSHPEKMTAEQIQAVEDIVNQKIIKDLKISYDEYPTKVAIEEKGALGQFGDRYGDKVKVYKMIEDNEEKPYSFEICGGPHVENTAQLAEGGKKFKIVKEESSSAGIRRIKAKLQ